MELVSDLRFILINNIWLEDFKIYKSNYKKSGISEILLPIIKEAKFVNSILSNIVPMIDEEQFILYKNIALSEITNFDDEKLKKYFFYYNSFKPLSDYFFLNPALYLSYNNYIRLISFSNFFKKFIEMGTINANEFILDDGFLSYHFDKRLENNIFCEIIKFYEVEIERDDLAPYDLQNLRFLFNIFFNVKNKTHSIILQKAF